MAAEAYDNSAPPPVSFPQKTLTRPQAQAPQVTQPPKATRQGVNRFDPQLACPSIPLPLTFHPAIVLPCYL